jgi:hypothetical protein
LRLRIWDTDGAAALDLLVDETLDIALRWS